MYPSPLPSSIIKSLRLFCDTDGLLRCNTRIPVGATSYSASNPILLPKVSILAQIYIMHVHLSLCHGTVRDILSYLREEFWIPQARQLIRSVLSACLACKKATAKPYPQLPPPVLPKSRTERIDVFNHVGLDYAGPFYVKETRRSKKVEKAYVLLFTCAVSRAVHLELVARLDVAEFSMGFRNFVSRRGVPSLIRSDNALSFKRVAKELDQILTHPKMEKYIGDHRIRWEFYLERAPWWGGFIERLVGVVKRSLLRVVGKTTMHRPELTTLLYEIEAVVNSRPITYLYDRVDEGEAITPSHLVTGKSLVQLPPLHEVRVDYLDPQLCRERLKWLDKRKTDFWNRFVKEYLTELTQHHANVKLPDSTRQVAVGDVVLVKREKLPRAYWKVGLVQSVNPGRDGVVRSASVKLSSGKHREKYKVINRSPSHLVPLEI